MKFQPGDKVLVLHSNEEGEVIDIINDTMVMVEIRGVKFPAYIDQLDFPDFKQFFEKKVVPEKKDPSLRELLLGSYRIIYRIVSDVKIDIITIHHSKRLLSNNPALK